MVAVDDPRQRLIPEGETSCGKCLSVLKSSDRYVWSLVVATVFFSAFDVILWKKALNRFHSKTEDTTYTFFAMQAYVLMAAVPSICFAIYRIKVSKVITAEMRAFPTKYFFFMSCLDTLSVLCTGMSGAVVPGHIQTLMTQANLPVTIVCSIAFLGAVYTRSQYLGATLIICGALIAAIPSSDETDSSGRETQWWGLMIYAFSTIPFSLGNVYREFHFKRITLDVIYMMAWTFFFQLWLGWLVLPILLIPIFGGTTFDDLPLQISNGWKCFCGQYVEDLQCEDGIPPGLFLSGFVLVNFLLSILRLLIIKKGSALLLQIVNAMALLASNIAFSIHVFMGSDTESFHLVDGVGLILVISGFSIYQISKFQQMQEESEADLENNTKGRRSRSRSDVDAIRTSMVVGEGFVDCSYLEMDDDLDGNPSSEEYKEYQEKRNNLNPDAL